MRGLLLLCGIFFVFSRPLQATGDSLHYLVPSDTIFLSVGYFGEKMFEHQMEKRQTLFSLAKFYGLSVEELYFYNPGLKDRPVTLGQKIKVPIPNRAIRRYETPGFRKWEYVPVYYVVKRGDTMFRISRVHFRMPIDTIRNRAGIQNDNLKPGQMIPIGWMRLDGIPESYRDSMGTPLERRNRALQQIYERTKAGDKIQSGVAAWQKNTKAGSDFYALHREAPINSIIEVINPMTYRTTYVKVIGRIPDTAYGNNVKVVLSPMAAQALGAKDPRFYVKVRYRR